MKIGLPGDRLESVLEARPELGRYMAGLEEYGEWAMASMAKWLSEGTVGEMLYRMNTPEAIVNTAMIAAVIGRYARPVSIGEKPLVCCM